MTDLKLLNWLILRKKIGGEDVPVVDKKELKKYRNIYKKIEQLEQEKADLLQLTAPKLD